MKQEAYEVSFQLASRRRMRTTKVTAQGLHRSLRRVSLGWMLRLVGIISALLFLMAPNARASKVAGELIWCDPKPGRASVYIIRKGDGFVYSTFLILNSKLVGALDGLSYFCLYTEPGFHILQLGEGGVSRYRQYMLALESGQEYFFMWWSHKRQLELIPAKGGRFWIEKARIFMMPTEKEIRKSEHIISRLEKQRLEVSPGVPLLVAYVAAHIADLGIESIADLDGLMKAKSEPFRIPKGSPGEMYAYAQIADLIAGHTIEQGDFMKAALFLDVAIQQYRAAIPGIKAAHARLKKRKWLGILGDGLLAGLAGYSQTHIPDDPTRVNQVISDKQEYLRYLKNSERFLAEAERQFGCLSAEVEDSARRVCIEGIE